MAVVHKIDTSGIHPRQLTKYGFTEIQDDFTGIELHHPSGAIARYSFAQEYYTILLFGRTIHKGFIYSERQLQIILRCFLDVNICV